MNPNLSGFNPSYETVESFTGRVVGLYAIDGTVAFTDVIYEGRA